MPLALPTPPALLALALAMALTSPACAQTKSGDYQPQVGQSGKDVVWVPTPELLVERMLTMAQVTAQDFVIDLGSGDGRTVIAAAKKFGAQALGIEYNPDMVTLSQHAAQKEGVSDKAKFMKADIFESDFSRATVITMYLLPGLNLKLRPKLLQMKPGTRLVSHQFTMDDWQPDETSYFDFRPAYLWIVPAQVAGEWQIQFAGAGGGQTSTLTLEQTYQKIKGTIELAGNVKGGLRDPRLWGDEISFALVDSSGTPRQFSGRVAGEKMEGNVTSGATTAKWSATKNRSR